MAYNNGRENRKWLRWKEAEEKILRECGVDESTIEQIRTDDRAEFNSDRHYYSRKWEVGSYLEDVAEGRQEREIGTVTDLKLSKDDSMLLSAFTIFVFFLFSMFSYKPSPYIVLVIDNIKSFGI